jgi:hypothetical protein
MLRVLVCCGLLLLAATPPAYAEWHLTPFAGLTMFGNTNIFDPDFASGERHLHGGGSVSWLSRGIFGVEAIGTWTPGFFQGEPDFEEDIPEGELDVLNSRAISVMGNVLVTLPQRWTEYGLRPFVSGGFGLMHAHRRDRSDVFPVNVKVAGFNIGGGAVGFLTQRTGLRFDIRYHSTLNRNTDAPVFSPGPIHLRYITASVGIVFRRGVLPRR